MRSKEELSQEKTISAQDAVVALGYRNITIVFIAENVDTQVLVGKR